MKDEQIYVGLLSKYDAAVAGRARVCTSFLVNAKRVEAKHVQQPCGDYQVRDRVRLEVNSFPGFQKGCAEVVFEMPLEFAEEVVAVMAKRIAAIKAKRTRNAV